MEEKKNFSFTMDQPAAGTAIFRLDGRLRGRPECFEFQEAVRQQVSGSSKGIILDMSGVSHVDSTGVGILAALYTSTKSGSSDLVLAGLTPKVQKILDVLWFLRILKHEETVEAALASLGTTD